MVCRHGQLCSFQNYFIKTNMETKEKNFLNDTKSYLWYDPYLFKEGNDGMLKRCISNDEVEGVLYH